MLSMPACIEIMESALASLAKGEVVLPLRPMLKLPDTQNVYALMPSYSRALNAIGTKFITVFPGNHGTDLDSHQGAIILIDGERGNLQALIDAASVTAIRTAAVSGVATKLLAREDAETLTILGSGVQARTHFDAMMAVRPFKRVIVWSRNAEHAHSLAKQLGTAGPSLRSGRPLVEVIPSAESAVADADVICTVTASREPVLRGAWLKPGAHINAVGASLATARELDTEAVKRARIFVDRRESALNEAGDILIPMKEGAITADAIVAELGEVLTGAAKGRRDDEEITLFKSLGLAIEDLACAQWLYERASKDGIGTWVDL
jgi:ornithine cyclodeaminase/alanine dehydrogenase-like protein (mu-crystallin family)